MMATGSLRRLRAQAVIVAAVLGAMVSVAAPSQAAAGDSVKGGGIVAFQAASEQFSISAIGSGTDDAASGTLTASAKGVFAVATVSCLHVVGTTAWVGLTVTRSSISGLVGHQEVDIFNDNSPDTLQGTNPAQALDCGSEPIASFTSTVVHGGFRVVSAGA